MKSITTNLYVSKTQCGCDNMQLNSREPDTSFDACFSYTFFKHTYVQ